MNKTYHNTLHRTRTTGIVPVDLRLALVATSIPSLQKVSIRNGAIPQRAQLFGSIPVMRTLRHLSFALSVDSLVVQNEYEHRDDTSSDEAKLKSMPENVPWRVFSPVEVGGHGCKC